MVAPLASSHRIICTAVRIDEPGVSRSTRLAYKPSELVPWADPYIAGLVRRLQSEIHFERATALSAATAAGVATSEHADLEPPSPSFDADWEAWDRPRWTLDDEPAE